MALVFYIALLLFFSAYLYSSRNSNHWKTKNVPFDKPFPFVGSTLNGLLMRHCFGEIFYELYKKSKTPIFGFFTFDKPCLLIRDLQIIKRVLVSDFKYFSDRSVVSNERDDPISTLMLFFLKNPEWHEIRSKITPVFTSMKMRMMSELIEDAARELKKYLSLEVEKNSLIEMKEVLLKFTVDVITSTAFGVNSDCFKNEEAPFLVEAKRMFNWDDVVTSFRIRCYFMAHMLVKIFRMKLFNPVSIKFLEESFWRIMDQRTASKSRRNDLIDILIEMKNSDKQFLEGDKLISQAVIFFVGGFETSSSTLIFALHELAHYPEFQVKLRSEIEEVSDKYGGINYNSVKKMTYLDMCVKEVLRKYPILPVLERQCNTQYIIPETGTVIDKNISVFVSVLGLHYDAQNFSDPERFDPERFSPENASRIKSFSYLPFGEGPRICIGARFGKLTVKLGLANMIQNFHFETDPEATEKIKFNPNGFLLSPLKPVKLRVTKL